MIEEQLHHRNLAVIRGPVERHLTECRLGDSWVCTTIQQQLCRSGVAAGRSPEQWRSAIGVARVRRSTFVEQEPNHRDIAKLGGYVQRSAALGLANGFQICTPCDQMTRHLGVTFGDSNMQSRANEIIGFIYLDARGENLIYRSDVFRTNGVV
jgi:hypothetical protein